MKGSKLPLIQRCLEYFRSKNSQVSGIKIVLSVKNGPKPKAGH